MMFQKKTLITAMAAAMVFGAGLSTSANAVQISNTDVGQVLMGELYLARSTAESTRITVINSDTDNAVKAKLVFRSKKHSDECRDVLLYLSPGDVAYVDVYKNAAGQVVVESDDDSLLSKRLSDGSVLFGSQQKFSAPFVAPRTEPLADTCEVGHYEVVAAYAVKGTVNVATGPAVKVERGMSKFDLIRIFDTPKSANPAVRSLNGLNAGAGVVTNDGSVAADGADFNARVRLKGMSEIKFSGGRLLSDNVALFSGANVHTGAVVTHNVTNPAFDVTVGAETLIGQAAGIATDTAIVNGSDKLYDIEGALKASQLFGAYTSGQTNFEITFPTKYRHLPAAVRYKGLGDQRSYSSPFFAQGEIQYGYDLFDTQEKVAPGSVTDVCFVSPCTISSNPGSYLVHEVNYEVLTGGANGWNPALGWFRFPLTGRAGVDVVGSGMAWTAAEGVPAVGYAHYYNAGFTNNVVSRLSR